MMVNKKPIFLSSMAILQLERASRNTGNGFDISECEQVDIGYVVPVNNDVIDNLNKIIKVVPRVKNHNAAMLYVLQDHDKKH